MRRSRFLLLFLTAWLAFGGEGFALTLCEIACAGGSHHESAPSCSNEMGRVMGGVHSTSEDNSNSFSNCCDNSNKDSAACLMQSHTSHEMLSEGANLEKLDLSAFASLIPIGFITYETAGTYPNLLHTDGPISPHTPPIYLNTSSFLC
ncbi:MAG: hypothetical protein C0608_11215 [Deltaproteobacteria bacterium]|nr:MAG: hypothetical protein C0608_11215 [Deltaproteobacteria bacterium]